MSKPVLLIVICLFSVVVNVRAIFVVLCGRRRRVRPVSVLVAHLSTIAICYSSLTAAYVVDKWYFRANLSRPGFCELLFYLGNMMYTALPLNVVGIIYQIIRSSSRAIPRGCFSFLKIILILIWIQAAVVSIPMIFMMKYKQDEENQRGDCKSVEWLGELTVSGTFIYELLRFIIYHLIVVGYLIYALLKIRSKLGHLFLLQPAPNRRMRRRLQKIRFVCVHSIVFILLWIPAGLVMLLHRVRRLHVFGLTTFIKIGSKWLALITLIFFWLSPLIYVGFIEKITALQFCLGRWRWWYGSRRQRRGRNDEETVVVAEELASMGGRGIRINYSELSRIATIGTGNSGAVPASSGIELETRLPAIFVIPPSPKEGHTMN